MIKPITPSRAFEQVYPVQFLLSFRNDNITLDTIRAFIGHYSIGRGKRTDIELTLPSGLKEGKTLISFILKDKMTSIIGDLLKESDNEINLIEKDEGADKMYNPLYRGYKSARERLTELLKPRIYSGSLSGYMDEMFNTILEFTSSARRDTNSPTKTKIFTMKLSRGVVNRIK